MRPFVNQNWVANFVNLIYFGPPTFPLVILALHHQLGQSFRLSSCISSFILDFLFLFFFPSFFVGSKVGNNRHYQIPIKMPTYSKSMKKKKFNVFLLVNPSAI